MSVARDHRDGAEDVQALPARKAKSEVRTIELGGAGIQHAHERVQRYERVVLVFDTRRDLEALQKRLRVSAELAHQIAVPPKVGGADEAGHSINSLCREMIKACRKVSRPTTPGSAILFLQRPASTAGQKREGSHGRTTFRRPDHRRRPVGYRYRLPRNGRVPEQDHRRAGAT